MVHMNILPRISILKILFHFHDISLLKLDVKFDFLVYDGELNAEKLDNWVKQVEVYCKVQKIKKDTANI